MKFEPPCGYQGSKQRYASSIVDILLKEPHNEQTLFYDLCCGSGTISIELVNRGVDPKKIVMVDSGPWGLFWKEIGEGNFDLATLEKMCVEVPEDYELVQDHIKNLSGRDAETDTISTFLLLQSASFGSKSIWIKDGKWKHHGFRTYWKPTETSIRRSPSVPIAPKPAELLARVKRISQRMVGMKGVYDEIENIYMDNSNAIVYIDPPYKGTVGYCNTVNIEKVVQKIRGTVFVSEGMKLSPEAFNLIERKNSGISGNNKKNKEEWLNVFRKSGS